MGLQPLVLSISRNPKKGGVIFLICWSGRIRTSEGLRRATLLTVRPICLSLRRFFGTLQMVVEEGFAPTKVSGEPPHLPWGPFVLACAVSLVLHKCIFLYFKTSLLIVFQQCKYTQKNRENKIFPDFNTYLTIKCFHHTTNWIHSLFLSHSFKKARIVSMMFSIPPRRSIWASISYSSNVPFFW